MDLLPEKHASQAAPFDASREIADSAPTLFEALRRAENAAGASEAELFFAPVSSRRPALLRIAEGALDGERSEWLWRAFFRGYWPAVAARLGDGGDARLFETISAIARFGVAWAGRSTLRPCVEILGSAQTLDSCFAAEDGAGRYFVYFNAPAANGLALALPEGLYRFYWYDPDAGRILDRGDSAEAGTR